MEPTNKKERSSAFWTFLLFQLITIALVVALVLVSIQVPIKENNQLRMKYERAETEKIEAKQFTDKVLETQRLLDDVNLPTVQSEVVDAEIQNQINEMYQMKSRDSGTLKSLYDAVVTVMFQFHESKKNIRASSLADKDLNTLQQEIGNLKQMNMQLQQQNDQLRIMLTRQ